MSNYPPYPPASRPQMPAGGPSSPIGSPPPAPPRPAPPVRNRRSGRKRKKKTIFWTLTWWQGLILAALTACIVLCVVSYNTAGRSLENLRADRESERRAYEQEVNSHQVWYRDAIEYYAAVNRIDPAFVSAIIKRESDFDPNAVSRLGALGLMQIMPVNREWLAGKINRPELTENDMLSPETNIQMGCWYLGFLSDMFDGDPVLVASAYHAGQNNVKSWLSKYSPDGVHLTVDQIPMEDTRYYAGKVMNAYAIYQQHVFTN